MKRIGVFILFICLIQIGFGQKTVQSVVSSNRVAAFERFNFEILINNFDCEVLQPDFGGLEVVGGPFQSQSNQTLIDNGKRTQITELKWTYQLRAKEEGSYIISGVTMNCDGEPIESDPIEITVSEKTEDSPVDKDYYMRLTSNKSNVYQGEPFTVTLKYYSKARPDQFEALDLGDAVGIYRQDLKPDRKSFQTVVESINGVRYHTIVLREEVCFAQRNGEVSLEPYYASILFRRDFFSQFRKETYSNTLSINVKPIPGSSSADFNGLVGDFSIESEISNTHVKMGDAIDIKITIKGKGNMQDLGTIDLEFPQEFDQYEPEIEDKTSVSGAGFKGEIEYNFVIIPKHYGEYTVPGYSFQYFDLKNKKMKTAKVDDFIIQVDKREGLIVDPPKTALTNTHIQYIEEQSDGFFEQDDFVFGTWTYYGLVSAPLFLSFFFIFFKRKKENISEEDLLVIQQKKAVKNAQLALKEVHEKLDQGDDAAALKGLQTTVNNFFMQKFNVGLSDLSQRKIAARLTSENIDTANLEKFNKIWNTIEMGQFAPIAHENIVQTVKDTESLLIELDKKL
ncbi:MAG: hypothetical protein GQ574_07660 [Crocinitomix sp.]|nr:hypothetical protein [Crocinitomix sp.]